MGLTKIIAIERKSISDLVMCVGRERERFDKEVQRLLAYPTRLLIIEGTEDDIRNRRYRGQTHPNAIINSLLGWSCYGLPYIFAGDRGRAAETVRNAIFIAARRRFHENAGLTSPEPLQ